MSRKGVVRAFFRCHFFGLCEFGESNQKAVGQNLKEPEKIGEVGFYSLSICLYLLRKLDFREKFAKNLVSCVTLREKNYLNQ